MKVTYIGDCDWLYKPEWVESEKDIEIVNDLTCGWEKKTNCFNVFIDYNEPDWYLNTKLNHILERVSDFDLIVTRRPELLKYPHAKKLLAGGVWLTEEYRNNPNTNKDPSVSFTNTNKCLIYPWGFANGYDWRRTITRDWEKIRDRSSLPLYFYNSQKFPNSVEYETRTLHETNKNSCMNHMFHISVENQSIDNYITEKIIDCFASKTIPIYFGCENLGDYFDMDGVLVFRTEEHLFNILENLSPQMYEDRRAVIEKNYELSKNWWDTNATFWNYVVEGINKS